MQGKVFFIPGTHKLIYCHRYDPITGSMILGGLTHYVGDTKTNILRQKISDKDFKTYNPVQLDELDLSKHAFLELSEIQREYRVHNVTDDRYHSSYLRKAMEMPHTQRFYYNANYMMP